MSRHFVTSPIILAALGAAALLGAPRLAWAGCGADNDCKGDRICVEGRCVDVPTCARDGDCPGKLVCEAARCVSPRAAPPSSAHAPPPPAMAPYATPFYTQQTLPVPHYRNPGMRRAGVGLVIAGLVLDVLGGTIIGSSFAVGCSTDDYGYSDCGTASTLLLTGAAMSGIGAVMWITGIPLWVVGGSQVSGPPPAEAMGSIKVGDFRVGPGQGGHGIALSF